MKLLISITILTSFFSCAESKIQKSENSQNVAIENNNNTSKQPSMQENNPIQAKNSKLQSIELQHTNPSLGPYEKITTISLANSPQTAERINEFLDTSIINETITISEYIEAYIDKNVAILSKINANTPSNKPLNKGESISNLTFYFKNDIPPLEISDVYRRYSITNFYGDFTTYMVENGVRSETSNGLDVPEPILPPP